LNLGKSKNQLESFFGPVCKAIFIERWTLHVLSRPYKMLDDTDLSKTGKTIEAVSKIYNYVSKTYYLGFKLLVAGYWNWSVFTPIDFSLFCESKKSKLKYGLTAKQRKVQMKIPRRIRTVVAKRYRELNKNKTDLVVQMFLEL
jgi:hypothetical protein